MSSDLLIVFLLLLINGFFAMAEIAIVSARKARLRQVAEDEKGARRALDLAEDPSAFFSIVQIGVTFVGVTIGAFSGKALAIPLGEELNQIPWIAPYGQIAALGLVVVGVTYFSLVLGELVPKRIGFSYAEAIAIRISGFMNFFAKLTAPIVWLLGVSTDLFLKLLGLDEPFDAAVTEEEVKEMIAEGAQTGVFKPAEKDMIEGVMRLADRSVRTLMTPRIDMVWLAEDDTHEENMQIIHESGYSRFPLARGDMDEVLGIVYAKDLLNASMEEEGETDLLATMRQPLIVPDTTPILRLLDQFKNSSQHLAIVIDEYGSVEGMVTVTDVLEAITGDLPELGQEREEEPVLRDDGSWILDGMKPIDEVEMLLGTKGMHEGQEFHTLAGFIIDKLGRLAKKGDAFEWQYIRFEVLEMDGRRISSVLVAKLAKEED